MKNIIFLILIVFGTMHIQAQIQVITGTLTDGDYLPLPGVNVVVKGLEKGTTTDFDGNYKILAKVNDILVFSYVGSIEQRIVVKTLDTFSFKMREPYLDEIIKTSCRYYRGRFAPNITYQYAIIKF